MRRPRLSRAEVCASFEGRAPDGFQDVFETAEYVVVDYSQNCETAAAQDSVTTLIAGDLLVGTVRRAFDLDDQSSLETDEIDDEFLERSLSTKMQSLNGVSAKARPEQTLGLGGMAPQRSGDLP